MLVRVLHCCLLVRAAPAQEPGGPEQRGVDVLAGPGPLLRGQPDGQQQLRRPPGLGLPVRQLQRMGAGRWQQRRWVPVFPSSGRLCCGP